MHGNSALVVPLERVDVKYSLSYEEVHIEILHNQVLQLRNKEVILVKVLWQNQSVDGATLEIEENMITKYPHFFSLNIVLGLGNSLP